MSPSAINELLIHNPGSIDRETLLEEFIAREDLLADLLKIIAENREDEPQQHALLIGPRGMGKTTTLYAVAYKVEDDPILSREWLPLIFSEENYGIGDLADFWLEAVRFLEGAMGADEESAEQLLAEYPADLAEQAQDLFFTILKQEKKRVVLLLDNINEIFQAISDERELHDLRSFLMEDPRLMVIGASTSYFSQINELDQPFYGLFRIFHLERFNRQEMELTLRTFAERKNDKKVLEILKTQPERVQSLRILTGGNPRLVKMVYRLLHEGAFGDVRRDLQRLLDECTPYFKHRIETLKPQPRRVFDSIARNWDPVTVSNLSARLRKPSNFLSVQIKRLIQDGFLEEAGGTEKKKFYQVAERFYNIYYLMRYSRNARQRLHWLIGFMKVFYSLDDYRKWADRTENEIRTLKDTTYHEERLVFLSSLSNATEDAKLRRELLKKTIKTVIDTAGMKSLTRIIDTRLAEKELGTEYTVLRFLTQLSAQERQDIGYQPDSSFWWYNLTTPLEEARQFGLAEQAYRQAIKIDPEYAFGWNCLGNLFSDHLGRYEEAEKAYKQAIKIDPEYAYAWHCLGNLLKDHMSRYEEAEQAYRQAIKINPEYAYGWNRLGKLLKEYPDRYEEAEKVFKKSIKIDPEYAYPYVYLAELYAKQDKNEEALRCIKKGIVLEPNYLFPQNLFRKICQGKTAPWIDILPHILAYSFSHPEEEVVFQFALEGLILVAGSGNMDLIRSWFDKYKEKGSFEIFLLALNAGENEQLLQTLSPERRELLVDVIEKIKETESGA
jgi:tetratricopeptide (TPR) repeat protein